MRAALEELLRRSEGSDELLELLKKPFSSNFQQNSIWASFGTSVGFSVLIAVAFSLLRPYNSVVYAPKLKHADEAHAPPPMGKGILAWFGPVIKTKEQDLIRNMGLDAAVFLRFTRMCRNIFLSISVIGCAILIPINLRKGTGTTFVEKLTPLSTSGSPTWAQVVCAYLFNIVVAGFLWFNYRKIVQLRRQYYDSPEYLASLHARTLMINDIPKPYCTDEGIGRLIDEVVPTSSFSRTAIARNVKDLPDLIAQHEGTVRKLEKHLAKYLKNPDQLPPARPTCNPSKKDPSYGSYAKGQKVDAIEYLTGRIRDLEMEIKDVRLGVDKRNAMPYGFASYEDIGEAHTIAYAARNKHPHGTTIVLAPRPDDIIWQNMHLDQKTRRWRRIVNNLWVTLLTLLWIGPNAMISIFLVNLENLGRVWGAFKTSLSANGTIWSIVQGVASPAVTSLIYLVLPIIFRRLSMRAGDRTKTARERNVTGKLYTFFVFNNLIIFSGFSTVWTFVSAVVEKTGKGQDAWKVIQDEDIARVLFTSLCSISPFWVTWLLQRNLGAAIDLAQLWTLFWSSCVRKFSSPTPRELIELTAPPAFDYAAYYNYFLFYSTVTLTFATIQPLVLPAAALYFTIDVYLKKYLLLYVFVTKTESGGMFWRVLFNRMVFASILANLVVFLAVWVQGDSTHIQAFAVIPLPFLMVLFKIYCARSFDKKTHYYSLRAVGRHGDDTAAAPIKHSRKTDRLASRFGHPALYKPLTTPMVHARAQSILASIYSGRLSNPNNPDTNDIASVSGYSDTFTLSTMKAPHGGHGGGPGKLQQNLIPGFEVVPESQLDFSFYKNRAEFGDDHGAGDIFTRTPNPYDRPGTADTYRYTASSPGSSRAGSPAPPVPGMPSQYSRTGLGQGGGDSRYGTASPPPPFSSRYSATSSPPPPFSGHENPYGAPIHPAFRNDDRRRGSGSQTRESLVRAAAGMPDSAPVSVPVAPGFLGGGPMGYGGLPQEDADVADGRVDYDYYRGRRGAR
ncbi:hypothetical protein V496_06936 [Pseudogymnoascus sp. VKM F-4515 (FW-2607)]|nr:hypothetical protein V496_06936 [Pseudogymnoascus sp. VKM F-4515 (FW-2607)]